MIATVEKVQNKGPLTGCDPYYVEVKSLSVQSKHSSTAPDARLAVEERKKKHTSKEDICFFSEVFYW